MKLFENSKFRTYSKDKMSYIGIDAAFGSDRKTILSEEFYELV